MSIIISGSTTKKYVNWIGEHVNSPEQRLILGATALATQPIIDFHNKNVDEDTRMISVARTLAKIIAGTLVGVAVRHYSITAVNKYSKYSLTKNAEGKIIAIAKKTKKDIFTPVFAKLKECSEEQLKKDMNLYTKAMGTALATVAMIFTNFAVDAPLTRLLTRGFHSFIKKNTDTVKKEGKT